MSCGVSCTRANPQWVWIAMDRQTRQIIAFHIGNRSRDSAKQLWANIPKLYRKRALFYTDHYAAYTGVIPAAQHKPIGKYARKTNYIERFNNTLRQRVSRLVRSTLAFSKTMENHIGAIRYFICHYNLAKAALLVPESTDKGIQKEVSTNNHDLSHDFAVSPIG